MGICSYDSTDQPIDGKQHRSLSARLFSLIISDTWSNLSRILEILSTLASRDSEVAATEHRFRLARSTNAIENSYLTIPYVYLFFTSGTQYVERARRKNGGTISRILFVRPSTFDDRRLPEFSFKTKTKKGGRERGEGGMKKKGKLLKKRRKRRKKRRNTMQIQLSIYRGVNFARAGRQDPVTARSMAARLAKGRGERGTRKLRLIAQPRTIS